MAELIFPQLLISLLLLLQPLALRIHRLINLSLQLLIHLSLHLLRILYFPQKLSLIRLQSLQPQMPLLQFKLRLRLLRLMISRKLPQLLLMRSPQIIRPLLFALPHYLPLDLIDLQIFKLQIPNHLFILSLLLLLLLRQLIVHQPKRLQLPSPPYLHLLFPPLHMLMSIL